MDTRRAVVAASAAAAAYGAPGGSAAAAASRSSSAVWASAPANAAPRVRNPEASAGDSSTARRADNEATGASFAISLARASVAVINAIISTSPRRADADAGRSRAARRLKSATANAHQKAIRRASAGTASAGRRAIAARQRSTRWTSSSAATAASAPGGVARDARDCAFFVAAPDAASIAAPIAAAGEVEASPGAKADGGDAESTPPPDPSTITLASHTSATSAG